MATVTALATLPDRIVITGDPEDSRSGFTDDGSYRTPDGDWIAPWGEKVSAHPAVWAAREAWNYGSRINSSDLAQYNLVEREARYRAEAGTGNAPPPPGQVDQASIVGGHGLMLYVLARLPYAADDDERAMLWRWKRQAEYLIAYARTPVRMG